jgi:hypothetical protein
VKDYERVRDQLIELSTPLVGEPITAIGHFYREGLTQGSWTRGPRWVRRTFFPRAGVAGDQLGMFSLIALSKTRLYLIKGVPGPPVVKPKRVIGTWPLRDVTMSRETVKTDSYSEVGGTTYTRIARVTLQFADGTAPLPMDFLARDDLTKEIVQALQAALG